MPNQFNNITVYCGSADDLQPVYHLAARQLGCLLAQKNIQLIYGGGKTGLMGVLADSVLANGGKVIGVVPENLNQSQLIHSGLTSIELTPDIQTRQRRMIEMADASIAMPGGFGTLYELLESLTWAQIGMHHKPIGVLNTNGYFDPLTVLFEHAMNEGFIYPEHRDLLAVADTPEALLAALAAYTPPVTLSRWVDRS
ncbi:MAG: TIGR00730 family Rossman fold protein [Anaerolinea sp.]|nr:TIGR00730 family Rossman fold protein [Anaerolinea sp.]